MENNLPEVPENQLPRLTVKEIKKETLKHFNLEKGLPFTYIQMFKNPYKAIQTYLYVDRKRYFNPFRYILFAVALFVVIANIHPAYKTFFKGTNKINTNNFSQFEKRFNISIGDHYMTAQEMLLSYQNLIYLIVIPLISLITLWILSNTKRYNYAENLAINAFCFGTTLWTSVILNTITVFFKQAFLITISSFITYSIIAYLYKKIYQESWLMTIVSTFIVAFVIVIIGALFIFSVTGYLMATT